MVSGSGAQTGSGRAALRGWPRVSRPPRWSLSPRPSRASGLKGKLVGGLTAQQRHEPVRACLDFHLGHHGVLDHAGDQAGETVADRVRGDRGAPGGGGRRLGPFLANWASAAPSTARRPAESAVFAILPLSAQRSMVS